MQEVAERPLLILKAELLKNNPSSKLIKKGEGERGSHTESIVMEIETFLANHSANSTPEDANTRS